MILVRFGNRFFLARGDKGSPEHLARIAARRAARAVRAS